MRKGFKWGTLLVVGALLGSLCLSATAAYVPEGICYNVRNSKLFNKNNVAPAINETIKKMKSGDKLYLQSGNYKFKETIKLANDTKRLSNCSIVLEGVYTMDGDFDAMLIDGDYLDVEIGTVTSGRKTGYTTQDNLPGGIRIRESNYSDYSFGIISGFDYGLRFAPVKSKTGECYNKFRFQTIQYCYSGLNLLTQASENSSSPPWVNENAFYGGKITNVYYGVLAKKGKFQIDEYNNNSYWNIAFQNVEKDAVFSEFSSYNSFVNPTFSNVKGFYINQKANSKANKFYVNGKLPISKIAIYSKGEIITADLTDNAGNIVASQLTTTNLKAANSVKKGFTIKNTKNVIAGSGTTNLPLNVGTVTATSSSGEVVLKADSYAEYENYSFTVNVTGYNKPITIKNSGGAKVVAGKITGTGKYKVVYMGGSWRCVKLI